MLTPEQVARRTIDAQLGAAGWFVAAAGTQVGSQLTALCESTGDTGHADCVLCLDGRACGLLEGKGSDHSLEGVQEQAATYAVFRKWGEGETCWQSPLPFPPHPEQHQIVAEVETRTTAIDHLEAELDRQITRSNRLRQSTLATAFSGNL